MKTRVSPVVATTRMLRDMVSREHGHDIDRLIDRPIEQRKATRGRRQHRVGRARNQ